MNIEKLDNILEAILFVSGNGISVSQIQESLGLQKSEIQKALAKLKEKYGGESGIKLLTYNGKIQFSTNAAYADSVAQVLNPIREKELSTAALETVAIVAYRQPVTRLEIDQIRGVNCDYTIQVLLKHNLIEVVGRKEAIGKPVLFGTTEEFLKRFGLSSIAELPDYEQLLETIRILGEREQTVETQEAKDSIYNEYEIPEEEADKQRDAQAHSGDHAQSADPQFPDEEVPDFLENEKDLKKVTADEADGES